MAKRLNLEDIVTFGKYAGQTVDQIITVKDNPQYILWLHKQNDTLFTEGALEKARKAKAYKDFVRTECDATECDIY